MLLSRRFGGPDPLARLQALRREIDAMLGAEIAERRADPREDILSLLVEARFEDGEPMDDAEIRDQLMTLLLAGHETTATGLAWTFDLLLRHPHVLERLARGRRRGLPARRGGRVAAAAPGGPARRPAAERGAARQRPRAPARHRRDAGDLAHPHPRRTATPSRTRSGPSASSTDAPATYAWIPFGGGVRRCLGAAFAEMEMRVALAEIVRRRTLRPASGSAERVARRNVTFSPRAGTRVIA